MSVFAKNVILFVVSMLVVFGGGLMAGFFEGYSRGFKAGCKKANGPGSEPISK